MDELLRQVAERDAELAAARRAAGYAGEPDPYRRPRAEDEDKDLTDRDG
jgi:ribosome-binding factor A